MNTLSRLGTAFLTALAALVIVFGALSVALMEGTPPAPVLPISTSAAVAGPLLVATQIALPQPSATIFIATSCPVPPGWQERVVQPGDTLQSLASLSGATVQALSSVNCLLVENLLPGSVVFLPPVPPTATAAPLPSATFIPCGPPYGWVRYVVRPGDTLFRLSLELRVSVIQLQWANCLGGSTLIRTGDVLFTPFIPPIRTASPATVTASVAPSNTATTQAAEVVTNTPTHTATATDTPTATDIPTATNTPTATDTPTATEDPLPNP